MLAEEWSEADQLNDGEGDSQPLLQWAAHVKHLVNACWMDESKEYFNLICVGIFE